MFTDPIMEELHKQREVFAKRFNHDIHAIFEHLREEEKLSGHKYVSFEPERVKTPEELDAVAAIPKQLPPSVWEDPIVAEVRRHRDAYAKSFNYDIHAICEDIRRMEKLSGHTFVTLEPKRVDPKTGEPIKKARSARAKKLTSQKTPSSAVQAPAKKSHIRAR